MIHVRVPDFQNGPTNVRAFCDALSVSDLSMLDPAMFRLVWHQREGRPEMCSQCWDIMRFTMFHRPKRDQRIPLTAAQRAGA